MIFKKLINNSSLRTIILLKRLFVFIKAKRKKQIIFLLVMMILSGIAEMISLAALIPFLTFLTNPDIAKQNINFLSILKFLNISESRNLALFATLGFVFAVIFSCAIRTLNIYLNGKFSAKVGSELSTQAFKKTLYQPYQFHTQVNSSDLITATLTQTGQTVIVINLTLQILSALFAVISIFIGLISLNKEIAITMTFFLFLTYLIIFKRNSSLLIMNGSLILESNKKLTRYLQEGLGAIRDIILRSNYNFYIKEYKLTDSLMRDYQARNNFIGQSPRFLIEALGLSSLAILSFLFTQKSNNNFLVIPVLGTFALGAQRLLPSFQIIYAALSVMKSYYAGVSGLVDILERKIQYLKYEKNKINFFSPKTIKIKKLNFSYDKKQKVLDEASLVINKGDKVGFIGKTGGGKSTLIDLIMGLLVPNSGKIVLDDIDIHDPKNYQYLIGWRKSIAHVPQSIFLLDASIAENIALGEKYSEIDFEKLKLVAYQAKIDDFIEKYPEKYKTFVGERGIRLSGGQRQRIAIARALYMRSELLVLDEATSALDINTEKLIMKEIDKYNPKLTVLMIAHRLSTIKNCNRVFEVKNNKVIEIRENA